MIKFIGIVAIVISTSLIGFYSSDKLKNRVKELNLINYMLEEISILIRYKAMTVYEMVEYLISNKAFSDFEFLKNIDKSMKIPFKNSWEDSINNMQTSLNKQDIKLLKSFGASLGTSDVSGQLSTIEVFKEDFSKSENDARTVYENKSKLYRSLGVLVGAFVSIMLI